LAGFSPTAFVLSYFIKRTMDICKDTIALLASTTKLRSRILKNEQHLQTVFIFN
jgi:hypothetical protein